MNRGKLFKQMERFLVAQSGQRAVARHYDIAGRSLSSPHHGYPHQCARSVGGMMAGVRTLIRSARADHMPLSVALAPSNTSQLWRP